VRRLLLTSVLVVGALSGFVRGGTQAYLTAPVSSAGNQFTAGNVKLDAGIAVGDTLTMSNLVPGDSFTARLTIQNSGDLDMRYAMTTAAIGSAALTGTLTVAIRLKTGNPCSSQDGTLLYGPAALDVAAIGDPAHGNQSGDRVVTAGATEDLCFSVVLPASATSALEEMSGTATFAFSAEQV
jgi:spore coat-associated protein N